jgi:hypothetical protein
MLKKSIKSLAIFEKNILNALLASLEYGLTIQDRDYNILSLVSKNKRQT